VDVKQLNTLKATTNEKEKDMPKPTERELTWSFVGTGWQGRREKLEILKKIPFEQGKQKLILQDNWDSKEKLGREEMLQLYLNSWCIPCPGGQNPETSCDA
jgi:hypothetical protein